MKNRTMARMSIMALFFATLTISINAQAPSASPEASPESIASPATSPSSVEVPAYAPTSIDEAATPAEAPLDEHSALMNAPEGSISIAPGGSISIALEGSIPITPEASPFSAPEASIMATSEASISVTPEASPSSSPELTPSFSPETTPSTALDAAPSTAPAIGPSAYAPGPGGDFAYGLIADGPDTGMESPLALPISEAPAFAPSSPTSAAIRIETRFTIAGLVASVLAIAAVF